MLLSTLPFSPPCFFFSEVSVPQQVGRGSVPLPVCVRYASGWVNPRKRFPYVHTYIYISTYRLVAYTI